MNNLPYQAYEAARFETPEQERERENMEDDIMKYKLELLDDMIELIEWYLLDDDCIIHRHSEGNYPRPEWVFLSDVSTRIRDERADLE